MKTAFAIALIAFSSIAVSASAQEAFSSIAVPASAQKALQYEPGAAPGSPATNNGNADAPRPPQAANPNLGVDDSLLIDNGLWDGASVGPCCAICGGGSGCPPDWYTDQGVRLLGRSVPRKIGISYELVSFAPTVFSEVMNNRAASPDVSVAYATTIGHYFARDRLNRDHFVEFSYWGLNGWKDSAAINSETPGSLLSGFYKNTGVVLPGFDAVDQHDIFYSSYTHNFEINGRISPRSRNDRLVLHPNGKWRRECQPGQYMSYLYGLRFMKLDETFRFHGQDNTYDYTGDYDVATHNNLLGLQVGADMTFRQCRWSWGVRSKLGAFINFSDQVSNIISPDLNRRLAEAKHEASLIGEVGFQATYKFRPNLMGRAAYDFNWVTGLALASDQMQFVLDPVNKINTNGMLYYHGVSLGLEWLW